MAQAKRIRQGKLSDIKNSLKFHPNQRDQIGSCVDIGIFLHHYSLEERWILIKIAEIFDM